MWVVIRDGFIIDSYHDTKNEADERARSDRKKYQGTFRVALASERSLRAYDSALFGKGE